jgi:CheY-like chemotaxis protein
MERDDTRQCLRGVFVVLVDEEAQHRTILRDLLRYCGAWVHEIAGAEEAQTVLRETTPNALVLSVRAPGDEAWRTVRALRALQPEHGGKLPIIGVGPRALASTAREHGLDGYLAEPIEAMVLCRAVADLLE